MIFDSIAPIHEVLDGMNDEKHYRDVVFKKRLVVVEPIDNGRKGRIVRLISTDPADFLRPELAPGRIIRLP